MNDKQIVDSLSSIHLFLVCTSWLSTSEKFWDGLREVYTNIKNDCAFVDPTNTFYNLGEKITEEYAVRTNFLFWFIKDNLGIDLNDSNIYKELFKSDFISILENSRGVDVMYKVLNKTKNAKTDYIHAIAHQKKKNLLVGWKN